MLVILIIIAALLLIGALFYRQSLQEYRINQIEWDRRHELDSLFDERAPIVVRGMPQTPVWTHQDVMMRDFYAQTKTPDGKNTLRESLLGGQESINNNLTATFRKYLYQNVGLGIWCENTWSPVITNTRGWLGSFLPLDGECFVGEQGLMEMKANRTLIVPTEGAIIVQVLAAKEKKWLPKKWSNLFPGRLTAADAPFIGQLKYMDIILRPGTALWIPAHWLVSWTPKEEGEVPLACAIYMHTPISWLAAQESKA